MDTSHLPAIQPDDPFYFAPQWFRPVPVAKTLAHPLHQWGAEMSVHLLPGQFCYIMDLLLGGFVYVSPSVEQVLGYTQEQFTLDFSYQQIHSDDVGVSSESGLVVIEYCRAHPEHDLSQALYSIDNRIRHADGHYRRILHQQYFPRRDPQTGSVLIVVSISTDISAHKPAGEVNYAYSPPDFPAFAQRWLAQYHGPVPAATPPIALTTREKQVLGGVVRGLTSKQIAYELGLTEMTVHTYRRNIQQKLGTRDVRAWLEHLPPTGS